MSVLRFSPVLFDLDGTLVDSGRDIAASVNRTLEGMGLAPLPEEEIIGFVGNGVRRTLRRALRRHGRPEAEDEAVRAFKTDYRRHCAVHTRPYPGVADLLGRLGRARVGVVTNKMAGLAGDVLEAVGLAPLAGVVVGGDETERIKPDPAPLLLACGRLGVPPAGGIMVGDHQNDIEAARTAGMASCGVLWGFDAGASVRAGRPDFVCASMGDLCQVLLGPPDPGAPPRVWCR